MVFHFHLLLKVKFKPMIDHLCVRVISKYGVANGRLAMLV